MAEKPVSINSSGRARLVGFMGRPVILAHFSGTGGGRPSRGTKEPLNTRFNRLGVRGACLTWSEKITVE
jgi:hypothetical protein